MSRKAVKIIINADSFIKTVNNLLLVRIKSLLHTFGLIDVLI